MPVATQNSTQRRTLHFESIDQVLAELEMLAAAEKESKLRTLGNWTPGQNLGHLSSWIDYSYDGVPFKIPFIARIIMRPMKNKFLYKPMRPGSRIPRLPHGTVGIDVIPFDEALSKFRTNLNRLKAKPPEIPHSLFGPFTHEEWIAQHLRHAELHLSFLRAD